MSNKSHSYTGVTTSVVTDFHYPKFKRCVGPVKLRSELARDIACLLDFDESVSSWACQRQNFQCGFDTYRPDFIAEREHDILVMNVITRRRTPPWIAGCVVDQGFKYREISRGDVDPIRLKNCRDLIHYAGRDVTLGDRVRVIAALDHEGTLSVADCLTLFRETRPIVGLANMALERFVSLDLDTALIGPDTAVRKFSN